MNLKSLNTLKRLGNNFGGETDIFMSNKGMKMDGLYRAILKDLGLLKLGIFLRLPRL